MPLTGVAGAWISQPDDQTHRLRSRSIDQAAASPTSGGTIVAMVKSRSVIAEREGLKQISDTGALEKIVDEIIAANPKQVEQYKSGKTTVIGFFVGQVMKQSRGQANPAAVNAILAEKLK
jgi:Asp-tRNA(Asn)/Glu-tRNA(Gln) amidotransferase B subunit